MSRSPFRRPCLDCQLPTMPGESRCPTHLRQKQTERNRQRGPTPHADRLYRTLKTRHGWPCNQCGCLTPTGRIRVDHIVPLGNGGQDHPANLQLLCHECHHTKTTREAQQRNKR